MTISVIAVTIAVSAVTAYLIYDMRKSQVASVALIAKIAGDRNSAALAFQAKGSIEGNLEIYHFSPSIRAVCIYNESGELFGAYKPEDNRQDFCKPKFSLLPRTLEHLITVQDDIVHSGSILGHIYVVSDTREIDSYVAEITKISLLVTALTLIFIFMTAIYFSRTLSGPVLELTSTIQSITDSKNYSVEAKTYYNDEIGILAKAFNKMLGEVLKRDKELADANERLEEKIVQRTREYYEAKQKAESANRAKSEFLRNMSHEFRTPLHAILSFSSYGLEESDAIGNMELRTYFQHINNGSARLGKLVNEVLDFAKLENNNQKFDMKYADLRDLSSRAYEPVSSLLKDKDIQLNIDHCTSRVGAICDHDKIIQVITNLFSNAIKFTPAGKSITLRTFVDNNMACVSVTDEGVGVPQEETEMIFESFRQSSRTNNGAGGTGLGLAICRDIVLAHQGKIWVENNPSGIGVCVTFTLPLASSLKTFYDQPTTYYHGGSHATATH